jgi:hypothetical protein
MQQQSTPLSTQFISFSVKAIIVFILFMVAIVVLLPDFTGLAYSIKKVAKDEKTRLALMSFIQNPAALYRASEIDEKAGKFSSAEMEMELAVGLLEMHNANQLVIKRYETRLKQLKSKFKSAEEAMPAEEAKPGTSSETVTYNGKSVKRWKQ